MRAVVVVSWSGGKTVKKKISFVESPDSSVACKCDTSEDNAIVAHPASKSRFVRSSSKNKVENLLYVVMLSCSLPMVPFPWQYYSSICFIFQRSTFRGRTVAKRRRERSKPTTSRTYVLTLESIIYQ